MKKMNKLLALAMMLALILCLCACGSSEDSFETRMTAASQQMSKLDSMHMDMDMALSMELSVMGQSQSMDMAVGYKVDVTTDPARNRLEMNVTTMGVTQTVLSYTEQENGVTTSYVSSDGGQTWQKSTNPNEISMPQDPSQALQLFQQNAKNFHKTGQETINGSPATVYSGTLGREYLEQILQMSGMDNALSGLANEDLIRSMFSDLKDIPMTVAIDDRTGYVVRYTMDMTDLMQAMMTNVMKMAMEQNGLGGVEVKVNISNAVATMSFSQFNAVGEILIPEEARNA